MSEVTFVGPFTNKQVLTLYGLVRAHHKDGDARPWRFVKTPLQWSEGAYVVSRCGADAPHCAPTWENLLDHMGRVLGVGDV